MARIQNAPFFRNYRPPTPYITNQFELSCTSITQCSLNCDGNESMTQFDDCRQIQIKINAPKQTLLPADLQNLELDSERQPLNLRCNVQGP